MNASASAARNAFPANTWTRLGWILFIAYFLYAASHLDLSLQRFASGLEHGAKFVSRLFPPDLSKTELLVRGMLASPQLAVLASARGVSVLPPHAILCLRGYRGRRVW